MVGRLSMKFAATIVAFLLFASAVALAQHPSDRQDGSLILLSSPDAAGAVSIERLNSCLHQVMREWRLDVKSAPRIVVMHVSKQGALMASVTSSPAVRRNTSSDHGDVYYEVWLVDAPKISDYLVAFENVIEQHYQLTPTENERKQAMQHAARVENSTISVYEGK